MFHPIRPDKQSSICNSKRRHQTLSLLLAALLTTILAGIMSQTWTSSSAQFFPTFRVPTLSGSTVAPGPICPAPPTIPKLSDAPNFAPPSLKRYIAWHKSARKCLESQSCADRPKLLVLRCTPGVPCGGLGDRFRAIELMFLLSIMSERLFLIDWPAGPHSLVSLETVFHPGAIDWRMPHHIQYDSSFQLINWSFKNNASQLPFIVQGNTNYFNLLSQNFAETMSEFDRIAISSNAPHTFIFRLLENRRIMKKYDDLTRESIAAPILLRALVQTLFKPTRLVETVAEQAAFPDGATYISVHGRIGEDTLEADRPRFNKLVTNMDSVARGLLNCAQKCAGGDVKRVFLASDSTRFKSVFEKVARAAAIEVKNMEGKVLHVGKNFEEAQSWPREEQCESFLRIFADLYLLSGGSCIVTTGSGFSKAAFHLGNAKNVMIGYSTSKGSVCTPERMGS